MILINNTDYLYHLEALSREFFPGGELVLSKDGEIPEGDYIKASENDGVIEVKASFRGKEKTVSERAGEVPYLTAERTLFTVLSELTGKRPYWGILTGVRPAKLYFKELDEGKTPEEAEDYLRNERFVSEKKTGLLRDVVRHERDIRADSNPNDFSMYISIPFCPSRCSYCSFTAIGIEKAGKLIPEYVDLLCKEIKETAAVTKELGLRLRTIYMGGGTPTTLSAEEMERVLAAVRDSFDMESVSEITVEAGRPDTITKEKLLAMKRMGVTRISVNPQTMNDEVLKIIGRKHSADDIERSFAEARELGFDNINMDLISGLPGDTPESFRDSVSKIIAMGPENITLHTLTLKRGSTLRAEGGDTGDFDVEGMNEYAYGKFYEAGYEPYYLYRQKGTIDNLENVGFTKKGYECMYNVYIMDETHSVISCGAGGSTILKNTATGYIEREYNFKYPFEYIERFGGIEEKKAKIAEFYNKL